jgi:hypothetical protein
MNCQYYVGYELYNFLFLKLSSLSFFDELSEISLIIVIQHYALMARFGNEIINNLYNKRMFMFFHKFDSF